MTSYLLLKEFGIAIAFLNPILLRSLVPKYVNPRTHLRNIFLDFEPFNFIGKSETMVFLLIVKAFDLFHQLSQLSINLAGQKHPHSKLSF